LSEPDEVAARECFGNTFAQLLGVVGVAATGWLVDVAGTYSALFVLTAIMSAAGALIFGLLFNERRIVDWPTSSSAHDARGLSRAEVEPRRWRERRSAS
jgi:cyanate permease